MLKKYFKVIEIINLLRLYSKWWFMFKSLQFYNKNFLVLYDIVFKIIFFIINCLLMIVNRYIIEVICYWMLIYKMCYYDL